MRLNGQRAVPHFTALLLPRSARVPVPRPFLPPSAPAVEVQEGRVELARAEVERRELLARVDDLRAELADTQEQLAAVSGSRAGRRGGAGAAAA